MGRIVSCRGRCCGTSGIGIGDYARVASHETAHETTRVGSICVDHCAGSMSVSDCTSVASDKAANVCLKPTIARIGLGVSSCMGIGNGACRAIGSHQTA